MQKKQSSPTSFTSNRTIILAIILISYFMIVLDISIVITALPKIRPVMGFSVADLSWVQNAYTLAFGGLLLLGARAGDILGRRRMFMIGIGIFTFASLLVGLSQSELMLIISRALQGIGAATLAPSTLSLLTTNFPEGHERTKAVAYYGAVAGVGASVGLVLGGILTSWISWRAGFFLNIPIGIAMILATPRYIAKTEKHSGQFDLIGAITSTLGMTSLVYGIVNAADTSWGNPLTVGALIVGIILLAYFVFNEKHAKQPIMPLRLFANRERPGAYIARILFLGGTLGFWFFLTQYLQTIKGFSPIEAGIAFLPMTIANFIVAVAVPKLTRRFGNAKLLAGGLAITMIGMFFLSRLSAGTDYLIGIALPMILIGIGQGASLGPLTAAGISGVSQKDAGAASGVVNVAHQLGGSLGLGILVTVFAAATSDALSGNDLLAHQIATALTAGTIMLALALILTYLLLVHPQRQIT